MNSICNICNHLFSELILLENIPRSSAYLYDQPCTNYETAKFIADYCEHCGYIKNKFVDNRTDIYKKDNYKLKTAVSGAMSANLNLIRDWILDHFSNNTEKIRILEVGSGSGELANWFADQGADVNTIDLNIKEYENKKINHTQGQLDNSYIDSHQPFDLIIARHLLEHVDNPQELLSTMSQILSSNGKIYIEVPNGESSLNKHRLVDYFNDHLHHFMPDNIKMLANSTGLICEDTISLLNSNHIGLMLTSSKELVIKTSEPIGFLIRDNLLIAKEKLFGTLKELKNYHHIIIYGAGAHSATFASQLNNSLKNKILYVWDRDPKKIGKFLPGIFVPVSNIKIEQLPDNTVIVNTSVLYEKEVESYLRKEQGLKNTILHL